MKKKINGSLKDLIFPILVTTRPLQKGNVYRSLDCAGPLADGSNRQNVLDIYIIYAVRARFYRSNLIL